MSDDREQPVLPGMNRSDSLPYIPGSATSKAAAKSMVKPSRNQRQRVWEHIHCFGGTGKTCHEVEEEIGIIHGSCASRIWELREMGRIERTGRTRTTPTGREADVYIAVEKEDWIDDRPGWPTMETLSRPQKMKQRIMMLEGLLMAHGIEFE